MDDVLLSERVLRDSHGIFGKGAFLVEKDQTLLFVAEQNHLEGIVCRVATLIFEPLRLLVTLVRDWQLHETFSLSRHDVYPIDATCDVS